MESDPVLSKFASKQNKKTQTNQKHNWKTKQTKKPDPKIRLQV